MIINKPKDNQILFEDDNFKHFKLEVQSKTGLNKSKYNNDYDGIMLCYRQPNMDASKQIFFGNSITICTLICSSLENLLTYGVLNEDMLEDMVKQAILEYKNKKEDKSSE